MFFGHTHSTNQNNDVHQQQNNKDDGEFVSITKRTNLVSIMSMNNISIYNTWHYCCQDIVKIMSNTHTNIVLDSMYHQVTEHHSSLHKVFSQHRAPTSW